MKPLVVSEEALNIVARQQLPADWFINPTSLRSIGKAFLVETDGAIYVLSADTDLSSSLLVIRRTKGGLFEKVRPSERRQVFDRCARIALRDFGDGVQLNPKWMPYHGRNFVSVFAFNERAGADRIVAESHPKGRADVYVCAFSDVKSVYDLEHFQPNYDAYDVAISDFPKAVEAGARRKPEAVQDNGQIELDDVVPDELSKNLTYDEWYPKHLSKRQIDFVEHEIVGPLKLRGAAGTGKTLAMIIKAIKTAYDADEAGKSVRILFATHSWAGAEFVDTEMRKIDTRDIFRERASGSTIDVFPLLTLAQKRDYSQIGYKPLGVDSSDGKKQALSEITEVIANFVVKDWVAYKSGASETFIERIEASSFSRKNKLLSWDLLIEFGCVLAAQGILTRDADLNKYLRVKRMRWMMPLANNVEKEAVFRMWGIFVERLRSRYLVSSDQIIFDALSDLGTFFWESARRKEGYDFIFVDEMHLFNSQERLIFHNLLRNPDAAPLVVMALDPKQSPRETFVEVRSDEKEARVNIFEQARLPNPESIDLTDIYRYTPEITELVRYLHEIAPALDLPADWDIPLGHSKLDAGDKPQYQVVADRLGTLRAAVNAARKLSRAALKRNGRVAILCLDEERFDDYTKAAEGQNEGEVFIIASRDDTERLRYSGKRFLLSTPEYVAGLQFDTVVLVDANREHVPDGQDTGYLMRRFLSELYLGVSRAQRQLIIFASRDAGGLTTLLTKAVARKLISETNDF